MPWSEWASVYLAYAKIREFRQKVERAKCIASDGASKGRLFGSISGGKDSVALAGVLAEAGVKISWCHAHSCLNLPDTLETVDAVAESLNLDLDLVEPDDDPMQHLLFATPTEHSVLTPAIMLDLYNRYSAGELLRQFCYIHKFDGHFDGRRADENRKTRGKLFAVKGPIWRSAVDRKWSASPLAWWSARDSFAFALSRNLPIHPFYRRAADLGLDPERARVDWLFGPWLEYGIVDDDTARAVLWVYPDRWQQLARVRPELASFLK